MDRFENNDIDGAWVRPTSTATIKVLNPSNGETIASVPDSTAQDVASAVDAARKAQLPWERLPAIERGGLPPPHLGQVAGTERASGDAGVA